MSRTAFLRLEWLLSAALILLAIFWAWLRDLPLATLLVPTPPTVLGGMLTGALLWGTIPLVLRAASMRRVWNEILLPFSGNLGARDVAAIALLSGLTEELFFRGVLMPEIGLTLSSFCFGALHALCAVYFAWATVVGAGFGALALASGSLVTPIVAHATYNLGALLWLRRTAQRPPAPPIAPGVAATIASPHGIG
jgi:membrane protease YdiL (CAAX protease family)